MRHFSHWDINLNILSGDESEPYMYADLDMDGGGVILAGKGPKAAVKQTSSTTITVAEGAEITALFGELLDEISGGSSNE